MNPYYEQDGITIYHGDCREVLPTVTGVDCVLTDPPYGTQDIGSGYGRPLVHDPAGRLGRTIANDKDLSVVADVLPVICDTITEGWFMVFFAARKTPEICTITAQAGLSWFGEVIWDKAAPGLGYHIRYSHENIAVFRVGEPPRPKDALLSIVRGTASAYLHPHEKPLSVISKLAMWGCQPDGLILDPFMGSGTTLVAAKELGRRAIGIELEERYCEIAANRLGQGVLALDCEPTP